jgi:triacylglycerol lipase
MYLVALLASSLARLDAAPIAPDPARPPVLLVHGIFSTGRDMERLARHLRSQGREVHVPTLTPNGGQAALEELARQLADYAAREFNGRRFDLVGFSMGGLVSRYYLQRLGGANHVNCFVSLAAPHHGTQMARLGSLPGWVQMRPGS